MDVQSGEILFVKELRGQPDKKTVRVLGRLKSYDAEQDKAVFIDGCFPNKDNEVWVETTLIKFEFELNVLYTIIGDLYYPGIMLEAGNHPMPAIRAHVMTKSERLDIATFVKALELRRSFLKSLAQIQNKRPVASSSSSSSKRTKSGGKAPVDVEEIEVLSD